MVLADARAENRALEGRLLAVLFEDERDRRGALLVARVGRRAVDEVLELLAAQLLGVDARDKRASVHGVGLARAVRADDRGEVLEGADDATAAVALEVVHLQPHDAAGGTRAKGR